MIQEALPREQNNTRSRTQGCVGREGCRAGRGRLPGISAVLSHPLDVTGQMAQGPLRSLRLNFPLISRTGLASLEAILLQQTVPRRPQTKHTIYGVRVSKVPECHGREAPQEYTALQASRRDNNLPEWLPICTTARIHTNLHKRIPKDPGRRKATSVHTHRSARHVHICAIPLNEHLLSARPCSRH